MVLSSHGSVGSKSWPACFDPTDVAVAQMAAEVNDVSDRKMPEYTVHGGYRAVLATTTKIAPVRKYTQVPVLEICVFELSGTTLLSFQQSHDYSKLYLSHFPMTKKMTLFTITPSLVLIRQMATNNNLLYLYPTFWPLSEPLSPFTPPSVQRNKEENFSQQQDSWMQLVKEI